MLSRIIFVLYLNTILLIYTEQLILLNRKKNDLILWYSCWLLKGLCRMLDFFMCYLCLQRNGQNQKNINGKMRGRTVCFPGSIFFFLIKVYLICNVVPTSAVQQSDPVTFFLISPPVMFYPKRMDTVPCAIQ